MAKAIDGGIADVVLVDENVGAHFPVFQCFPEGIFLSEDYFIISDNKKVGFTDQILKANAMRQS